jgi:2-polyprenyl-6-hydroxyphenyl methylase/3-demethylubiquinone-9 3-methyltransferase
VEFGLNAMSRLSVANEKRSSIKGCGGKGITLAMEVNDIEAVRKNIDPGEIAHFNDHTLDWWDLTGPLKPLHDINPIRLQYIENRIRIAGKSFLDVGCGGGILSESLALAGGHVTGIDMTESALNAAREHIKQTLEENITYRRITVEMLLEETQNHYDNITCMELLEHVPRPSSVVSACAQLLKPGGNMFVATVNRTWTAYLLVIVAAEHLLRIVRKGTPYLWKLCSA